jgi:hypothetical protein
MHSERVIPSDFSTDHFRAQLAERVAWAVQDAERETLSGETNRPPEPADSAAGTRAPAHAA